MRYYHKHLMIACAISALTLTPLAGAMFYLGREVRDWQKGLAARGVPLTFANLRLADWPGLLWPLVPLVALDACMRDWGALAAIVAQALP